MSNIQPTAILKLTREASFILRLICEPQTNPRSSIEFIEPIPNRCIRETLLRNLRLDCTPFVANAIDWANAIGEITWGEEFVDTADVKVYLPYSLRLAHNLKVEPFLTACDCLEGRLILEIGSQIVTARRDSDWNRALTCALERLQQAKRNPLYTEALNLYRKYATTHATGNLHHLSIRAIAESENDAWRILDALKESFAEPSLRHPPKVYIAQPSNPRFAQQWETFIAGQLPPPRSWKSRQTELDNLPIEAAIPLKAHPTSLLDTFNDGSLGLQPKFSPEFLEAFPNAAALYPANQLACQTESLLSLLGTTRQPTAKPRLADLLPLSYLFPLEVATHVLQLPFEVIARKMFETTFTVKDLIDQHGHLIDEDTYIVGLDRTGQPKLSSFADIPHRLVAGVTGSGKTNFLKSVIYQFLLASPDRRIWLVDFQDSLHYQLIAEKYPDNIQMIAQLEDFSRQIQILRQEHHNRIQKMKENRVSSLQALREQKGINIPRTLLIVDEAFYINHADRETKKIIDEHLPTLLAQARVTGIHIIYCTQRPTREVIPKQCSDNMDERILFRVQPAASVELIDSDLANQLPVKPRGRAVYRGSDGDIEFISTPYVPDEVWNTML